MGYAWHNGDFVEEEFVGLSVFDSAVATGDLVVEVVRTYDQVPFRLAEHVDRLLDGTAEFGFNLPVPSDAVEGIVAELVARNAEREAEKAIDFQIRFYATRGVDEQFEVSIPPGPTLTITCSSLVRRIGGLHEQYVNGAELVVPPQRAIPSSLLSPQIKSRGRLHLRLASLQAKMMRPGAFALLVDPDGCATEGSGANVFAVLGGELLTPPSDDVVAGVTRRVVLELIAELNLAAREKRLPMEVLRLADEVFITSTVIGLLHARSLDGVTIGSERAGPITRRIRRAFEELVGIDLVSQSSHYARLASRVSS